MEQSNDLYFFITIGIVSVIIVIAILRNQDWFD